MAVQSAPETFTDDDSRWQAVVRRDRAADGAFFTAVRTTGVYCRPSCPARHPRRENVRFYRTAVQAERAGFRACKRCRPNDPARDGRLRDAVAQACRLIEQAESLPTLAELAAAVGISPYHFHRVFKMHTGTTPKAYAAAQRARRVGEMLGQGQSVTRALHGAGFQSNGTFYGQAQEQLGMTPTAYRAGGAGATIRFAVGKCSLGAVLVAATAKGVCAIFLGDDPAALIRALQDRFRKAELVAGDADFDSWVARVVALVEQPALDLDLPLDIRGTAFQVRVWDALRQIPAGATTTYSEIARRIKQPKAVRAVGAACGANPIAVAIPCHRVVRTDESLCGYRWGLARKAELLKREKDLNGSIDSCPPASGAGP